MEGAMAKQSNAVLHTELGMLLKGFIAFTDKCYQVNSIFKNRKALHERIHGKMDTLEKKINDSLISKSLNDEDTQFAHKLLILAGEYQKMLLKIGKDFAEIAPIYHIRHIKVDQCPIIMAIDDLTSRIQTITASLPGIAGISSGILSSILNDLKSYRKLIYNYFESFEEMLALKTELNKSQKNILIKMNRIDERLSDATQNLNQKIIKTTFISSFIALIFTIFVICSLYIILRRLFKSMNTEIKERAKAEQALEKLNINLEKRVENRTRELSNTNLLLAHSIADRIRSERQISRSLKEKEVLLREIHHRVKNNMQVIVSLMNLYSRHIDAPDLKQAFHDCRDRVNAMSLIHEALYQSKDLNRINFGIYLKKLCRNLGQAHDAMGKGVEICIDQCNVVLNTDQGIAVGMVISELISNAFKHAFPNGKGGIITVRLYSTDGQNTELIVADNGIGISPEINLRASKTLGLRLAFATVTRELKGSMKLDKGPGTRFTIHFNCSRHERTQYGR